MDTLSQDAAALITALECAPCHFVGLSMGGFVGMRLAARQPELIKSLILLDTSAGPEPQENHGRYGMLNFIARWFGLGVVMGKVMPIMFGPTFLNDKSRNDERKFWRKRLASNHRIGITHAVNGVIRREGVAGELVQIAAPTLIMVGDEDTATVPAKSEHLHASIAGSEYVSIKGAGHSSTIEQPDAITREIKRFLVA